MAATDPIVYFFSGDGTRSLSGIQFKDFMRWNNQTLEYRHDYIQVVFPLPESSAFSLRAPIVTSETRKAFLEHNELRTRLVIAFDRILQFYGFGLNPKWTSEQFASMELASDTSHDGEEANGELREDGAERDALIGRSNNFYRRAYSTWRKPMDHNHLRITRIIRSLRVLGLGVLAKAFFEVLMEPDDDLHPSDRVSRRSRWYWGRAATQPLWLAPDDSDDAEGIAWLREELERPRTEKVEDEEWQGTKDEPEQGESVLSGKQQKIKVENDEEQGGVKKEEEQEEEWQVIKEEHHQEEVQDEEWQVIKDEQYQGQKIKSESAD